MWRYNSGQGMERASTAREQLLASEIERLLGKGMERLLSKDEERLLRQGVDNDY